MQFEPRRGKRLPQVQNLSFGPADGKTGEELQQPNPARLIRDRMLRCRDDVGWQGFSEPCSLGIE